MFYSNFHTKIVDNGQNFFNMEYALAGIVTTKLKDVLFCFLTKEKKDAEAVHKRNISDAEKDGLQYLSGYVVRKILKNAKKCNKTPFGVLDILESMVEEAGSQKLIDIQSRGGLTTATVAVNLIIIKAEELFREYTSAGLQHIQINKMIEELFCDEELMDLFHGIVEISGQHNIDIELKNNILITMLKLFLRVRSFSASRDIVAPYRQKTNVKRVHYKGIRKTLKEYTDKSNV